MKDIDGIKLVNEAKEALNGVLVDFMPVSQRKCLIGLLRGEERVGMAEVVLRVVGIINSMPKTYETEKIAGKDKIVHLHYFRGSVDGWIVEKDAGDGTDDTAQYQAYGKATLFGEGIDGAEWGYISIKEYIDNNVELDLYWTPKMVRDAK